MAIKKISELDTKTFLGKSGVAANSYVLVNYAENNNDTPVTYKVTIDELGKAVANNLSLAMVSNDTVHTISTNSNNNGYNNSENISFDFDLTDSYPFANDSDVLPSSSIMEHPKSLVVFAPFEGTTVGSPYIQLPGQDYPEAINLAGPYIIKESDTSLECSNLFMEIGASQIYTINPEDGTSQLIDPNCIGNFIKRATIENNSHTLQPLFIDTNNNTLYTFNDEQYTWQPVSL